MPIEKHTKLYLWLMPLLVGVVASSFYAYDFLVRVMPMAMAHELLSAFKIQASELSILFSAPVYSLHAYQIALTMIPLLFILALIIGGFVVKETYCKQQF